MKENIKRIDILAEYMKKEFGITPQNIDEKLEEVKSKLHRKGTVNESKA